MTPLAVCFFAVAGAVATCRGVVVRDGPTIALGMAILVAGIVAAI